MAESRRIAGAATRASAIRLKRAPRDSARLGASSASRFGAPRRLGQPWGEADATRSATRGAGAQRGPRVGCAGRAHGPPAVPRAPPPVTTARINVPPNARHFPSSPARAREAESAARMWDRSARRLSPQPRSVWPASPATLPIPHPTPRTHTHACSVSAAKPTGAAPRHAQPGPEQAAIAPRRAAQQPRTKAVGRPTARGRGRCDHHSAQAAPREGGMLWWGRALSTLDASASWPVH